MALLHEIEKAGMVEPKTYKISLQWISYLSILFLTENTKCMYFCVIQQESESTKKDSTGSIISLLLLYYYFYTGGGRGQFEWDAHSRPPCRSQQPPHSHAPRRFGPPGQPIIF